MNLLTLSWRQPKDMAMFYFRQKVEMLTFGNKRIPKAGYGNLLKQIIDKHPRYEAEMSNVK